jgi:hypothetical protein
VDEPTSRYYPAPDAAPPLPPRRVPRVAIAVGLTALFGLGGAGLALAAGRGSATGTALSASSSTTTLGAPGVKAPHGQLNRPGRRFGGPVVHAEYTVKDGSGYKTYAEQVGQVVTISTGSITVMSADGFTQEYAVESSTVVDSQAGGISAVTGKDTVRIEALVSGATQTATDIVDTTKIGASRQGFGYPAPPAGWQGHGPGGPEGPAGLAPGTQSGTGTGTGGSIPT